MATITNLSCRDENGNFVRCDAFGHNVALSCPSCGHPYFGHCQGESARSKQEQSGPVAELRLPMLEGDRKRQEPPAPFCLVLTTATMNALISPERLWTRHDVLATDAIPRSSGVYAWWFREIPPAVPTRGCVVCEGLTLLYVGIAPSAPPASGKPLSRATLRRRLRQHLRGNASASTLRLTLGCLLQKQLGTELRRVGVSERLTFGDGEAVLNEWLAANASVCRVVSDMPWEIESAIIRCVCLPLSLAQNRAHAFHGRLSACRAAAKARAREMTTSGD